MTKYTSFSKNKNDATKEPMFFGQGVNVARYDQQKYIEIEKLIEKQLSFFWRPEEIDVSRDRIDYMDKLQDHERHIFTSNLKYQTLLDSIQGRSPNVAFLTCVSIPELETWIETWAFSETVHSRSYTHIIRNVVNDPSVVFDDIVTNEEIIKRASAVAEPYDDFIEYQQYYMLFGAGNHIIPDGVGGQTEVYVDLPLLKRKLILVMAAINVLEGVRFFVSFACSFSFAERQLMEGNAKIIKLIARDEGLHLDSTQFILNKWADGSEGTEMQELFHELEPEIRKIFVDAVDQEKDWGRYLFKDGSVLGLNVPILDQYIEWVADQRLLGIGLDAEYGTSSSNPLPWMASWVKSDNVQVAPQEVEISSYLVGQIDSTVSVDDLGDMEL